MVVGIVLGVMVGITTLAAGVLIVFIIVLFMYANSSSIRMYSAFDAVCPYSKHAGLKRRYTQLMVTGESSVRFQTTDINVGAAEGNVLLIKYSCNVKIFHAMSINVIMHIVVFITNNFC